MILDTLWQEFLKIICAEVGSRVVETWFKAVSLVRWDAHAKTVYLKAPNVFIKDWVEAHYRPLFSMHLGRLLNETTLKIAFVEVDDTLRSRKEEAHAGDMAPSGSTVQHTEIPKKRVPVRVPATSRGPLVPQHQFESFVVGPNNSLAYAAAHAVAENPGALYNPLLIWGGSGLGKTHLLQAIGNHLKTLHKKATVVYQSADRFINEFVAAVRADRVYQFEDRYKGADVLLMDDIQYISNKEQTQEIFFQIFNNLHQARKQIVFTSNALPRDISGFHERIRTRLEGGLVADIQGATFETRAAILRKKAALHNIVLQDGVVEFMAEYIATNIRDLEGGLIRVLAFSSFTRQPVTLELVNKVLAHTRDSKRVVTDLPHVLKHVARHFNYAVTEIKSPKRSKDLALARHVAIYLMKKLTDRSLREIALFLEKKDHSTILHAVSKIEEQRVHDTALATLLGQLEQKIME